MVMVVLRRGGGPHEQNAEQECEHIFSSPLLLLLLSHPLVLAFVSVVVCLSLCGLVILHSLYHSPKSVLSLLLEKVLHSLGL